MQRRGIACILALLLAMVTHAHAATASWTTDTIYEPGKAKLLHLSTDAPGKVEIRGDRVVGIDYESPGKQVDDLPLFIYGQGRTSIDLTINGQRQTLPLSPSTQPTRLSDGFDPGIYGLVESWSPGRPQAQRQWIFLAGIFSVLAIGLVGFWRSRWTMVAALVVGIGLAVLFASRSELNRDDSRIGFFDSDMGLNIWTFCTTSRSTQLSVVPVRAGSDFQILPASESHLMSLSPVMNVESGGHVASITISLAPGMRAGFHEYDPSPSNPASSYADLARVPDWFLKVRGSSSHFR